MDNIIDYLSWRGDLRFSQSELNEIDMLIFAQLVHAPLERLNGAGEGMTLQQIQEAVYPAAPGEDANELEKLRYQLWLAAAKTPRFSSVTLAHFAAHFEPEREKQFAAALFAIGGLGIVAFRGTDATLIGWKEDFNMAFTSPVPSQTDAVAFLNDAAKRMHTLYVCGHSKGGNLSLYASSMCEPHVRRRIKSVYSFDGPGLDDATSQSDGYREINDRIRSFIPESSVIGLLLGYHDQFSIIDSDGVSLSQHNPYLWHVRGSTFQLAEETTLVSRFTDKTLHNFLSSCSPEERKTLVDTIFNILAVSKAVRLRDLPRGLAMHVPEVLDAIKDVSPESRAVLKRTMTALGSASTDSLRALFGIGDKKEQDELPAAKPDSGLPM